MDQYRLGTCSSCEAQYRVPASFKADKAKCKKCGGVVEIGPVKGEAPAAKPAPAKQPRASRPAKSGKAGKSTQSGKSAQPARAAKPGQASKAQPKAAPADEGESVRSATEEAATRVRSSGGKSKQGRSSSRRKGRTSKKKDSKMGLVLGIVALLIIAGGGGWFLMNKDKSVEAQDSETVAAADSQQDEGTEAAGSDATSADATEATEPTDAGGEADEATTPAADNSTPEAAAGSTSEDESADAEATEEEEEAKPEPAKTEIDLAALEDFGPAPGTSDDEWEEIQALVATTIDPNAGARGNRAVSTLTEKGRLAMPAVLNTIKTLDLGTTDGRRDGDLLQRLLERICNGNNYGWKYTTDEADVLFNEKVVVAWFKAWDRVVGEGADGGVWVKLGKLDDEQATAYKIEIGLEVEGEGDGGVGSADDLDDF